jgi:hypothetical protein
MSKDLATTGQTSPDNGRFRPDSRTVYVYHHDVDIATARAVYRRLKSENIAAFLPSVDILGGMPENLAKQFAIDKSALVVMLFSAEMEKLPLDKAAVHIATTVANLQEHQVFVIPVLINHTEIPAQFGKPINLSSPGGFERILKSIRFFLGVS